MQDENRSSLTRREVVAAAAFVPLAALVASGQTRPALSAPQMKMLEAFIDRIIPSDEVGPGALAAGAQVYIDRVLAGPNAAEKAEFLAGLQAVDAYARRTQGGALADLSAEKRDAVLQAIDSGAAPELQAFFTRARRLTLEGMFSDPYYGGNANFAGWDLLGYPGIRTMVTDADQKAYEAGKMAPNHKSAYDYETFNKATARNAGHDHEEHADGHQA